jgi:hypothetical protein
MVLNEVKNAIELNAIPKEEIKEAIIDFPAIQAILKSGGMAVIVSIPLLILAILGFFCLRACAKKYTKVQSIVDKLKKILFFNLVLRSLLIAFLSLCVTA